MFYYFSIAKASYMYDERYTRSTIANLIARKVGGEGCSIIIILINA